MIETVLAVLFVTFVFLLAFQLSEMLSARILTDHAAARAARAKAVGFNDFMCLKSARVALIPVSGRRVWPSESGVDEVARVPNYLTSENESRARAILDYERWNGLDWRVESGMGVSPEVDSSVRIGLPRLIGADTDEPIRIEGRARIESHFPYYMDDAGL